MKLTEAQKRALKVLENGEVRITVWAGKPFSGMPHGIRNRSTLHALHSSGLINVNYQGTAEIWRLTGAGRLALALSET